MNENELISETIISTAAEFISHLHPNKLWMPSVYRGQSEDLPLRPKLVRYFRPDINNTDYPTRGVRERMFDKEQRVIEEFQRKSTPYLTTSPTHIIEWLALAQHHGLGTRLLDWSENPLTALFFAVENEQHHKSDGVVWQFTGNVFSGTPATLHDLDQLLDQGVLLYFPKHIDKRIVAQQGCFTVQNITVLDPLEVRVQNQPVGVHFNLEKFTIPAEAKGRLRVELDNLAINHLMLFPDLGGLCSTLNWSHFGRLPFA